MKKADQKFLSSRNPVVWGFVATALLAVLVFFLGMQIGPDNDTRYAEFLRSQPNAIGDTLAGIFAPLAFIWIVVTVFLQSHELAEQRKELSLTREELKLAREAQEKQLEVMQIQADIFKDEKRVREEEEARRVVDELLDSLRLKLKKLGAYSHKLGFDVTFVANQKFGSPVVQGRFYSLFAGCGHVEDDIEEYLGLALDDMRMSIPQVVDEVGKSKPYEKLTYSREISEAIYLIDSIFDKRDLVSEASLIRVDRLDLRAMRDLLLVSINLSDIWVATAQ